MEYCAVFCVYCVHINREKKDKCFFFALLSYIIDTTSPPGDREENLFKTGCISILQFICFLVFQVNKALQPTAKVNKFIGVLDIYGFETFEV